MTAIAGKNLMTSFKSLTAKGSTKISAFSKNKLPVSVHSAGSKGANWVKANPMYAAGGAGAAGLAGGAIIG